VLRLDAVAGVPPAEVTQEREDLLQPVERADHGAQRRHQLRALLRWVASEQWLEARVELKQALVEQDRRPIPERADLGEAAPHQQDLFRSHGIGSRARPQDGLPQRRPDRTLAARGFQADVAPPAIGFQLFQSGRRRHPQGVQAWIVARGVLGAGDPVGELWRGIHQLPDEAARFQRSAPGSAGRGRL
jgi:hypothetical protein